MGEYNIKLLNILWHSNSLSKKELNKISRPIMKNNDDIDLKIFKPHDKQSK